MSRQRISLREYLKEQIQFEEFTQEDEQAKLITFLARGKLHELIVVKLISKISLDVLMQTVKQYYQMSKFILVNEMICSVNMGELKFEKNGVTVNIAMILMPQMPMMVVASVEE
jgi:hypothetical protein